MTSAACPHCGVDIEKTPSRVDIPRRPDILQTNEPPSDADFNLLRDTRSYAKGRVALLDTQIAAMQKAIENCIEEKATLQSAVEECDRILHPIRRMPVDIMAEIFFLVVYKHLALCEQPFYARRFTCIKRQLRSSLDPRQVPWSLAHVSHRWRSMVLSSPRLWALIRITEKDYKSEGSANSLSVQLQRSAACSLSVVVADSPPNPGPVMLLLLSSSSRWTELSFRVTPNSLRHFTPITGAIQKLQLLDLLGHPDFSIGSLSIGESRILEDAFRAAPSLRTVKTDNPELMYSCTLPWSQILELEITKVTSWRKLIRFVERMPNLQKITCSIQTVGEQWPFKVDLPHLKALRLEFVYQRNERKHTTLSIGTLLALEFLEIQYDVPAYDTVLTLGSPSYPIKSLILTSAPFTVEEYVRILEKVPTLEFLSLPVDESVSGLLETIRGSRFLVPAVKRIEVDFSGATATQKSIRAQLLALMRERKGLRVFIVSRTWDGGVRLHEELKLWR